MQAPLPAEDFFCRSPASLLLRRRISMRMPCPLLTDGVAKGSEPMPFPSWFASKGIGGDAVPRGFRGRFAMGDRLRSDGQAEPLIFFTLSGSVRMERPIGKRCQWDGIRSHSSGNFRGAGWLCGSDFPPLDRRVPDPDLLGRIQARACADSRKIPPDQREKRVFVLTKGLSVVGPRPVVEDELAAYGDDAAELLSVKPGITGWWQVRARNDATYEDGNRQELELCTFTPMFSARSASKTNRLLTPRASRSKRST